jgi:hypothetical protein
VLLVVFLASLSLPAWWHQSYLQRKKVLKRDLQDKKINMMGGLSQSC